MKGTSQEAFVFEQLKESVRFENDGSGVRETTAVIRIQSQAGVGAFGQLVFGYSTANEELRIDYVRVRTAEGQVTETSASANQDFAPEVLREAPMYSDFRERHVSVVGIRPGVWLEYHVVTTVKPLAAGEFWYEYSFPDTYALLDGSLQIDVPKARELKLKSPDRKFETQDNATDAFTAGQSKILFRTARRRRKRDLTIPRMCNYRPSLIGSKSPHGMRNYKANGPCQMRVSKRRPLNLPIAQQHRKRKHGGSMTSSPGTFAM